MFAGLHAIPTLSLSDEACLLYGLFCLSALRFLLRKACFDPWPRADWCLTTASLSHSQMLSHGWKRIDADNRPLAGVGRWRSVDFSLQRADGITPPGTLLSSLPFVEKFRRSELTRQVDLRSIFPGGVLRGVCRQRRLWLLRRWLDRTRHARLFPRSSAKLWLCFWPCLRPAAWLLRPPRP